MSEDRWIVIPNWERFQHYKNRNPTWIKLYTELAHDPDWDGLTLPQRGMLVTIWIEYASSRGRVSYEKIRRIVGLSFRNATLESLNHAGFITFSASKPLAMRYPRVREEVDQEQEEPSVKTPSYEANGAGPTDDDVETLIERTTEALDDIPF
jgi:hypothetical protein